MYTFLLLQGCVKRWEQWERWEHPGQRAGEAEPALAQARQPERSPKHPLFPFTEKLDARWKMRVQSSKTTRPSLSGPIFLV